MKEGRIIKETGAATDEDMELISRYSRRELDPQEVYVFSLILCDNEIDRDMERFSIPAIHRLAELFEGKTGIFDHSMKGSDQNSRIISAKVVTDRTRQTKAGEIYTYLLARAYMLRTEKNKDLILEIDGGIKKEVSLGCSIGSVSCSICGCSLKEDSCSHRAGKLYNGRLCHRILSEPNDAYEFSFVAVPAQPMAGVVKSHGEASADLRTVLKALDMSRPLALDSGLSRELALYIEELKKQAKGSQVYTRYLKKEILRLCMLSGEEGQALAMESVLDRLDTDELLDLKKSYEEKVNRRFPPIPQLFRSGNGKTDDNDKFKI